MIIFAHRLQTVCTGKTLRIIAAAAKSAFEFRLLDDGNESSTRETGFGCHWVDLPTAEMQAGTAVVFTFQWAENWEEHNFTVRIISSPKSGE
ncbi:MAG: hypothetical protein ABIZ81_11405 [Opitutaceae bacterium]